MIGRKKGCDWGGVIGVPPFAITKHWSVSVTRRDDVAIIEKKKINNESSGGLKTMIYGIKSNMERCGGSGDIYATRQNT